MDKFLFYREWSRILIEYEIEVMKSQNSNLAETIIKEKYRLLEILDKAYEQKNLTLLKRFFKDMNADIMELYSVSEREPVNARLRAVCGEDLTKYDKKLANSVQRIVKRGKIRNGDEYEKVRTYIDSIEGEPEHEALLQDLYCMTGDFESAVGDDPSLIEEEWK
jgi:hypothetical protein